MKKIKELMKGLAQKGGYRVEQDRANQRDQHQKDQNLDEINGGTGEVVWIVALRRICLNLASYAQITAHKSSQARLTGDDKG
ncbi:MAG: hypothetical protein MO852_09590 [Candidatus Devosia euplotis]|nr:hypothetical protein [Candidatus Devosia euplotis]